MTMEEPHKRTLCPHCGSDQVEPVRKNYSLGLGCLGAILFGWYGWLIGLLGGNDIEMYCMNCGHRWQPGGRQTISCCGCLVILIILAIIAVFC